ncbi:MAG: Crp/Fnr family transcriptional regulator [Burkholderiaceae bacterium]|nr:Crp/Fnr family transcriptional regulator [Burkholderiaceae bacterium]
MARTPLRQRARPLSDDEFHAISWVQKLAEHERGKIRDQMVVTLAEPGDAICRIGKPVTYWFGLLEGLLKMSNDDSQGPIMTFAGLAPGGWFGEGTALKREIYRYNVQALRRSLVVGLPVDAFHWLLDHSIGFNRFVMWQLNERLGQFIAAREIDRISDPDVKVARSLANLFHPALFPGVGQVLRITQQELAYLVGLSRQRVNQSLSALDEAGLIEVAYGGLRVLDLQGLRNYAIRWAF